MRTTLAGLTVLLSASAASAVPPTDGVYGCVLDGKTIGSIRIAGDTYAGLSREGAFGPPAKFVMLGPDRIFWLGEMGEMGELKKAGYRIDHTVARQDGGATAFDIVLLKPDQSGFVTAICAQAG